MISKTPAIMIQGTCSNAGKSLLTAALCRIFAEEGLNPAPFKAQNMALNSFVTDDGYEIGRAQALQATACGRAPDVRMNPVLLKPNSDTGSQVIVMGRSVGNMRVKEYLAYKPQAWHAVCRAYDSLAAEAGVMVIEGAGSPAEINLKAHDIVNMAMARYAAAPVLLVADIDRGGAFASLIGTMALLDEEERDRVAGFVLNKFRGDASLLAEALDITSARTGKPFLGTMPWLAHLNLPEEDSVSFRLYGQHEEELRPEALPSGQQLDIVLLDLPHISNFTDVDALRGEDDVRLRVVRRVQELGCPDLIILPGSKNTPGDLRHLHQSGLAEALLALAHAGVPLLGICGGLQILGQSIHDPLGLENGSPCTLQGLGLLPLHTELREDKTLRRCEAIHHPSGLALHGYEIHHGHSHTTAQVVISDTGGRPLGWQVLRQAPVLGTYLHGVLDSDPFRRHMLNGLRRRKGWADYAHGSVYSVGPGLDTLAAAVRHSLDMKQIFALLP